MVQRVAQDERVLYIRGQVSQVVRKNGKLMVHGVDIVDFFNHWKDRISIIHLHGVDGARDHLALDQLSSPKMKQVIEVLMRFCGPYST